MNDVMTDNHRCPYTEYTIWQMLSISFFVETAHYYSALTHIFLAIPTREWYNADKGREPLPGFRSTGKELTL